MPTTIDSAGITFNDATSLTSANIGTAQLVNGSVIASKLGTNEQKQICKAWVNFNGTTSPGTIRSSYNVSSVTKTGTGLWEVNFATPMSDLNYSSTATFVRVSTFVSSGIQTTNTSTSYVSVNTRENNANSDSQAIYIQVFGN
jgi:hypothetical protein